MAYQGPEIHAMHECMRELRQNLLPQATERQRTLADALYYWFCEEVDFSDHCKGYRNGHMAAASERWGRVVDFHALRMARMAALNNNDPTPHAA